MRKAKTSHPSPKLRTLGILWGQASLVPGETQTRTQGRVLRDETCGMRPGRAQRRSGSRQAQRPGPEGTGLSARAGRWLPSLAIRMGGERLEAVRASHQVLTLTLCGNVLDLPCEVVTLGLLGELGWGGVFIQKGSCSDTEPGGSRFPEAGGTGRHRLQRLAPWAAVTASSRTEPLSDLCSH